ncbi:MAG: hypothetical protein WCO30_00475 [bacterium]
MNKITKIFLLSLTLVVFLALPCFFAKAQIVGGMQTHLINITSSPDYPAPNSTVTLTADTSDFDINEANVSWYINGVNAKTGKGLKRISLLTPASGKLTKIDVIAQLGENKSAGYLDIKSADLTIIWEADSYTPPFYRGKALAPYGGVFRTIALPELYKDDGTRYAPAELTYLWQKNGDNLSDYSGKGRNVAFTQDKTYSESGNSILLGVSAPSKVYIEKSTAVPHSTPLIIFYPKDSLLGNLYNKAILTDYVSNESRVNITVAPYFFSGNRSSNQLTWNWSVDGNTYSGFSSELVFDTSLFPKTSTLFEVNISSSRSPLQMKSNGFNFRHYPNLNTDI